MELPENRNEAIIWLDAWYNYMIKYCPNDTEWTVQFLAELDARHKKYYYQEPITLGDIEKWNKWVNSTDKPEELIHKQHIRNSLAYVESKLTLEQLEIWKEEIEKRIAEREREMDDY